MLVKVFGVVAFVMSLSAMQAFAQDAPGVSTGSRVRLEAAAVSRKPMTGTILKLDQTSITLSEHRLSAPIVVPRDAITKMEVSTGRRSKAKAGALIGAAVSIGATALALSGDEGGSACAQAFLCLDLPPREVFVAFAGVAGACVGALVGRLIGQDKWTPVQASGLRVSVAPKPKGGAIRLSFAF